MPFKRKNASREYIDDSDDPEDTGVKTKKARHNAAATAASSASASGGDEDMIPLSAKRFVSVSNFRGKMLVSIREYYDDKETGELKPGRKGISLSAEQWEELKKAMPTIDERLLHSK